MATYSPRSMLRSHPAEGVDFLRAHHVGLPQVLGFDDWHDHTLRGARPRRTWTWCRARPLSPRFGDQYDARAERRSGPPKRYAESSSYFDFSSATTAGSASVVTSPSARPSAMSRSRRRMILPERVFGRSAVKMMSSGFAMAPIFLPTCARSSSEQLRAGRRPLTQRDERGHRLAFEVVRAAHDRGLGDARVIHERAFELHRADAMPRDVQHVVDAAEEPQVAVLSRLAPSPVK